MDALLRLDDRLVEEAALGLGGGGGGAVVGAGRLARPALAAARRLRVVAVERAGERPELAEVEVAADELLRVVQQQRAERQVEVEQLDDAELDRVLARADLRAVLEDGLDVRAVLRLEEVGELLREENNGRTSAAAYLRVDTRVALRVITLSRLCSCRLSRLRSTTP